MTSFAASRIALVLLLSAGAALGAEDVISIRSSAIAALPSGAPATHLWVADARPFALEAGGVWRWDGNPNAWTKLTWQPWSKVADVASDGRTTFLLLANAPGGATSEVERVSFSGPAPIATALPALPAPLSSAHGAIRRAKFFIAGNDPKGSPLLFSIDLEPGKGPLTWNTHRGWPGPEGKVTAAVGREGGLYLTIGLEGAHGERLVRWNETEGWTEKAAVPGRVVTGTGRAMGQAHLLFLLRIIGPNGSGTTPAACRLYSYHTITGSWAALGEPLPADALTGTPWKNGVFWARSAPNPSGSPFAFVEIQSGKMLLRWLDWIVIAVYLVSMLGMGLYFYLREKRTSTADFFVGGRSIPFWAVGVSLYAANTSSISYIAIPAKSFETNWQYLTNNLVAILALMFVAIWIVPLLRRLNLMSVFHYLETRFHPIIRTLASALFMAVQIGSRMSVILFLPSLALATITGIDVVWSILIMGVFTMIYTALGGMKAVVWTDVVQLIVKMGGIIFAIGFIIYMLKGGLSELFSISAAEKKMKLFDWSWDLTKPTVWGFIFLVLFDVVLTFPKDQVLMQRVLSTKSDRDASRSVWTFAAMMLPGGFLFYFVGTALYAFYKTHPERMNPLLTIDATFPLFIAAELPMGIRGLIIAGILAAAMATLSSIMNSVATLASVDFYEKLVKNPNPKVSVRFAEAMTVLTGLLGMGVAILLSRYDIHSLFDISIELAGLLGGGFAGAYTLGMFTRRANWQGVGIGVTVSIALTTIAWWMKLVHPYFYLAISICLCIMVGYIASWFFPPPDPKSLAGLTILDSKPAT